MAVPGNGFQEKVAYQEILEKAVKQSFWAVDLKWKKA